MYAMLIKIEGLRWDNCWKKNTRQTCTIRSVYLDNMWSMQELRTRKM